jgi:hypothetical protein
MDRSRGDLIAWARILDPVRLTDMSACQTDGGTDVLAPSWCYPHPPGMSQRSTREVYLAQLQFYLNHRRPERSDRPERVGKTPAEILTGQTYPHWLEMLGDTRFARG